MAIASYHIWPGANLTYISHIFNQTIPDILKYNPEIRNQDSITSDTRINVPFSCDCLNGDFLGHTFVYKTVFGDTYRKVATGAFANLTTEYWLKRVNNYDPTNIPDYAMINVTVNCSCGDGEVSDDFGLFATYPLRRGENLSTVAVASGVPAELLEKFNPGLDFGSGSGIVFVPARDAQGKFPPLKTRSRGLSRRAIAGITVAAIVGATFFAVCLYFIFYRSKKIEEESFLQGSSDEHFNKNFRPPTMEKITESGPLFGVISPRPTGITVDKSVEFSYEELAKATNNFSLENKIGQGGFGSVFCGMLKGERTAIKKMDMQASKEFLAELKVLTHVHHLNLVRLIGYCVEGSLFLVYEYIENGNLGEHLRGSGWNPLSWSTRVQIALDAARGLEYIHEHTVPLYIHRDIKSANILIDKDFRAKVADFGLTKLTEVGSTSFHTRLVGTFGYMPPEYAQYGDVSPKVDVYAFGVVLYELISAKEAIVKTNEVITESKGLVALFEDVLHQSGAREGLCKVVDPKLGDDYPLESVCKVAHLAKACTHENPQLRPSMRSIVVALMTLSSSTEDWDIGSFYENQGLVHLMSGSCQLTQTTILHPSASFPSSPAKPHQLLPFKILKENKNLKDISQLVYRVESQMIFQGNRSFELVLGILVLNILWVGAKSQCSEGCDALASFYVWNGTNLTFISRSFSTTIKNILSYNPQITDPNIIRFQSRVNVPFSCSCVDGKFMGHQFALQVKNTTTYPRIVRFYYSNLTTVEKLQESNSYDPNNVPAKAIVNVPVNCSCGNSHVSKDYGLFITYPLRPNENLITIANDFNLPQKLLEDYNPEANFSRGSGLVFIPGKDQNGTYPPLRTSSSPTGISGGAIAGISVAAVFVVALLVACLYLIFYRGRKTEEASFLDLEPYKHSSHGHLHGPAKFENSSEGGPLNKGASPEAPKIKVDKSVEFSYDELANASDNFSTAYKIGQGGFASVFYGELRGEKAAIKKMDTQATKEFLAELKVLTHVHHLNLVRLIGYCIEGSLFLVYEYVENGNLSQHLRGLGKAPLPWSTRVQIALDAARGLEYIHEHTVPVYIHRDIKSANILIDKNFRAKVADFGLTKLIEAEGGSMQTRLVGTFGYMAPEYGQFGDVSPKIDVYAFGVVLYELISARQAITKASEIATESKGLVALFEAVLNEVDPREGIRKLVDPKLGDDYPLDSVWKVALLAKTCTHENPQLRPSMRSIVVALMTISSSTADWNIAAFYENQGLAHLMSGR
ncbi:hypothetical protein HAX54_014316 [Datura stramonium]|uniref:Protein kinase domain-containing protein n=1 Tax=Datura stramonium TaxID=4076 RepID=A0ABS8TQW1_DATST|nr:hypothetical protein [Datura stramonium]